MRWPREEGEIYAGPAAWGGLIWGRDGKTYWTKQKSELFGLVPPIDPEGSACRCVRVMFYRTYSLFASPVVGEAPFGHVHYVIALRHYRCYNPEPPKKLATKKRVGNQLSELSKMYPLPVALPGD